MHKLIKWSNDRNFGTTLGGGVIKNSNRILIENGGMKISIIQFSHIDPLPGEIGKFEIFTFDKLFKDTKRFDTSDEEDNAEELKECQNLLRQITGAAKTSNKEIYSIFMKTTSGDNINGFYNTYQIEQELRHDQSFWDEQIQNSPRIFNTKKLAYAYFKSEFKRIEQEINESRDI